MKKIIVIGCPGSGKSTFSRQLNARTDIPLFHLDMMYWNADRTIVARPLFLQRLSTAMQGEKWIIDGNYASTMEYRLQACDTVFFLDYPVSVCLDGVQQRKGKIRTDLPWTETDGEDDGRFVQYVKDFEIKGRLQIISLLEKYPDKEIHIFTDRSQAAEFLDKL